MTVLAVAVAVVGVAAGWVVSWLAHRYREATRAVSAPLASIAAGEGAVGAGGHGPDDAGSSESAEEPTEVAVLADAACASCGHAFTLAEIAPLRWWARGFRCPECRTPQPSTWAAAQIGTPIACLAMLVPFPSSWVLAAMLWLVPVAMLAAVVDLRLMLIPRRVVWVGTAVGAVLLGALSVAAGEPRQMLPALVGAAGYFLFLFVMFAVSPRAMGFGDVRLAVLLGLYLGWIEPMLAAVGLFLASALGAIAGGLVWLLRADRPRAFPFGPAMVAGALLAIVAHQPILERLLVAR